MHHARERERRYYLLPAGWGWGEGTRRRRRRDGSFFGLHKLSWGEREGGLLIGRGWRG